MVRNCCYQWKNLKISNSKTFGTYHLKSTLLFQAECHNFIKVLHVHTNNKVFTCGTHAFAPKCSWREVSVASHILMVVAILLYS